MKKRNDLHAPRYRLSRRKVRGWLHGYMFILPWVIGVSIFFLFSAYRSLNFTFHNVVIDHGLQLRPLENLFANYSYIMTNYTDYLLLLGEFALSLVLKVPMIVSFALIIALLLNGQFRGRAFYRMIFFLPVIIATGPIMENLSSEGVNGVSIYNVAALANLLQRLPDAIFNTISELFASLISILWQSGIQMLIFLAGLQKVSRTMYEAAKIDGASGWECLWKITLPTIKPMILLNAVYTIIFLSSDGTSAVVEQISYATYSTDLGYQYALAMSWMYAIIIIATLGIVYFILRERSDKHVRYETRKTDVRGGVRT